MTRNDDNSKLGPAPALLRDTSGPALLDRYGEHLNEMDATDAQKREVLAALFRIMQAFVDLGFSVRSGDKFAPASDIGMDDVLKYLVPIDTAHETFALESEEESEGK